MAAQFRVDLGPLAPPKETPQGFLIVEGIASRAGVFEYSRADGSIQRELRLPEHVQSDAALSGYQGAPLTKGHPENPVTPRTSKQVSVGTVLEPARKDGHNVRVRMCIQDSDAIAAVRSKRMAALSTGYSIDLVETPGVHPEFGRYDAIQTNLVINHLALCETGRAGPIARIRTDSSGRRTGKRPVSWLTGWRGDAGMMVEGGMGTMGDFQQWSTGESPAVGDVGDDDMLLTTIEVGHQHTVDTDDYGNDDGDGMTSYATSEGADNGHCHQYIKNADGTYTITMNEGHTHEVVDPESTPSTIKTDSKKQTHPRGRANMKTQKTDDTKPASGARPGIPAAAKPITDQERQMLHVAGTELASARARATAAEAALAAETARADAAEGSYEATVKKLEEAVSRERDDEALTSKDEEIARLNREIEALTAQRDDALSPDRLNVAVRNRVAIERAAGPILALDKLDTFNDRELMVAVVEKLDSIDLDGKSDDFVRATFEIAVKSRKDCARTLDKIKEVVLPMENRRDVRGGAVGGGKSARDKYIESQQSGWKKSATDTKGA